MTDHNDNPDSGTNPPADGDARAAPLTVYYDRSCGLCRTEFETLELTRHGCRLVDCSEPGLEAQDGVSREAMMAALHVRDGEGRWHRGIDAFALIYRRIGQPRWAHWLTIRWLRPVWDRLYLLVAAGRYRLSRPWLVALYARVLRRARTAPSGD